MYVVLPKILPPSKSSLSGLFLKNFSTQKNSCIFELSEAMKPTPATLGLIIPCYNEETRLPGIAFQNFLAKNPNTLLIFVDDGSQDNTLVVLEQLRSKFPDKVIVLAQGNNKGKAEAVRRGVRHVLSETSIAQLGFLDADLATSLEEGFRLCQQLGPSKQFIFGSRILKLDNTIKRKWYRFLIGRMVASVISKMLRLPVYDTQCGCKMFSREWAAVAFKAPFLSRWLFDVELFYRLLHHFGKAEFTAKAIETPLEQWIDQGDSKISWSYGIQMWWDLFIIWKHYNRANT